MGGSWEGGSGWGTHVNPWLIHVNVWQKPLQYCKVISLQLIKINEKKIKDKQNRQTYSQTQQRKKKGIKYRKLEMKEAALQLLLYKYKEA